ncbi:MAG TPA: alpha/beta hydrolase, partial [Anaerolineales bacterium]|nr:alpha/beta hydrolase [Anaerolineales bacterium]
SRLRTASSPLELTEWLVGRTPDSASALSDAPKADVQAIAASMAGLQSNSLFSTFRSLGIPCLLVYGEKDQAVTTPSYESAVSTMTHQIVLENSGHFPMLDETAKFNRLLTDFLALDSGISPSELQMKEEWKRRVR